MHCRKDTYRKVKEIAIEKPISHPMWKHHFPSYLKYVDKSKQSQENVDNLKRGLIDKVLRWVSSSSILMCPIYTM